MDKIPIRWVIIGLIGTKNHQAFRLVCSKWFVCNVVHFNWIRNTHEKKKTPFKLLIDLQSDCTLAKGFHQKPLKCNIFSEHKNMLRNFQIKSINKFNDLTKFGCLNGNSCGKIAYYLRILHFFFFFCCVLQYDLFIS